MADLAKIQFRRTTTAGKVPDTLSAGEIALNVNDGRIWTSDGTNNKELGLAKGGTIDGELNITGAIRFPNGAYLASQDGNLYMTKSGTTGFIDALFLRKDKSDTLNGKLTVTGDVQSNTGMFYSNDGSHYLDLGKNGDNIANWGSYNGIWNFINTNGNGTSVSINNSTMSLGSAGDGTLKAGTIIFPAANAVDSNNDVSRGVQFVVESVDASSKNYPSGMGTLMTSVLSSVRVFQLYAGSGEQSLYFRSMRNDGSGNVAWNQVYTTANKPSPSDVGAYSTAESDRRFVSVNNVAGSGTETQVKATGSSQYLYVRKDGGIGYYDGSAKVTRWSFDSSGNLTAGNVPIAQGGTNANNASDARINLGLGNGMFPTYIIPNRTTGKATWYKALTMGKNVKTSSGKVQFMLTGMGNYGSGLSDFSIVDVSGRSFPPKHRRSAGSSNDVTIGYVDNGDSGWDIYIKDNSGWGGEARMAILSLSDWSNQITGAVTNGDFSGNNTTATEPTNIVYVDPESMGANFAGGIIQTNGEFIATNKNGLRITTNNDYTSKAVLLRNDGTNYNFLVSDRGMTTGEGVWNNLRPFGFSISTGKVTMGNGAVVTSGLDVSGGLTSDNLTTDKDIRSTGGWFYGNGLQINGNASITGSTTVGSLTTAGTVNLTGDNVQVNVGKNNDLALVKISGSTGKVAVGYGNAFQVIQSKNSSINTSDTFVNLMSVDGNTAALYSSKTNVNDLNVSGTASATGAIKTTNLIFAGGGMPTGFIPGSQGAYLGWNDPSGRGQTVLVNHKGSGNGGFTFRNSDGKTTTAILDIDGSGNANFLGNVLSNKIIGKDDYHYLDMSTDSVTLATYGGQFYFKNTNGNAQAQLSYSGNIYGSQWGNAWLSDYMEGRYANVTGQAFTGAVNFANNTWNKFGDDVQIGDRNVAGGLAVQGVSGTTQIALFAKGSTSNTTPTYITSDGSSIGLYGSGSVNVHANLITDGTGSFGGSLGANGISSVGSVVISNAPGGNNNSNGMFAGNGDGASWSTQNLLISSWYGIGFHDSCYNKTNIVFDVRAGVINVTDSFRAGNAIYQTDGNINGSIWGGYLSNYINNADNSVRSRADDAWNKANDAQVNRVAIGDLWWRIRDLGVGGLGTYGLFHCIDGGDKQPGNDVAGSSLRWSACGETYTANSPAGTWRAMGYSRGNNGRDGDQVSLYMRVA